MMNNSTTNLAMELGTGEGCREAFPKDPFPRKNLLTVM